MDWQASGRTSRFLDEFVLPPDPNSIAATIPLDIFVDEISPYLHVEDILALRRVNKHYFYLTHEPLIWKRFLQQLKIPLPPIRPTLNYSVRSSDYEYEQLVSRAISLEDNWRKKKPIVYSTMSFDACLEVLDMKLLPGGKYLIASIRDDYRFFIALYHLDHPSGPHILARCPIPTRAYQLQAKYMTYKRQPVIMIAFTHRTLCSGEPANATIDPPAQITHYLNCLYVDLSMLDLLAGAHRDPADPETTKHKFLSSDKRYKPFTQTVNVPLKTHAVQLSLYSRGGVAYASALQEADQDGRDYLVIVNIEHPEGPSILVFKPYAFYLLASERWPVLPHRSMKSWVKAVRHCPERNSVLIWRTFLIGQQLDPDHLEPHQLIERHAHCIEVLPMPFDTTKGSLTITSASYGSLVLPEGNVTSVHMTDDPYDGQSDIPLQSSSQPPPPISVFAEMSKPQGILHWHIWPSPGRGLHSDVDVDDKGIIPKYIYTPLDATTVVQTMLDCRPYIGHVLPGVFRSLVYTIGSTDRAAPSLTSLRRYLSPEHQSDRYPLKRVRRKSTVERTDYQSQELKIYTIIDLGSEVTARYGEYGLGAIAWDHTIGRLCLTTGGGTIIEVFDFSCAAPPDGRFFDKMMNDGDFERMEDESNNEFVVARRARATRAWKINRRKRLYRLIGFEHLKEEDYLMLLDSLPDRPGNPDVEMKDYFEVQDDLDMIYGPETSNPHESRKANTHARNSNIYEYKDSEIDESDDGLDSD